MDRLLLSAFQSKPLLDRRGQVGTQRSSADLGLTGIEVAVTPDGVTFGPQFVNWTTLEQIAREDRKVFEILGGEPVAIQAYSETTGWVRTLCPTAAAPTVLVSGIPMHRIKDTDPIADTEAKIRALGAPRGRVLDTATGLGYTAIAAARTADAVLTLEIDPAAIELARRNPWSAELFTSPKIEIRVGDAYELVQGLPGGSFGAVIHDPPTLSLGGELYSEAFYVQLRRILTRKGRLFHYIGDPKSHLGKKVWPGVMKRLALAGFVKVERHADAYGVSAVAGS